MTLRQAGRSRLSKARLLARIVTAMVLGALMVMAMRTWIVDVYEVREASMWPGLRGGTDYILVAKTGAAPVAEDRFAVWVFTEQAAGPRGARRTHRVKRVLGVEGEVIDFRGGDVYVGPSRAALARPVRSRATVDAMLVPVYLSRRDRARNHVHVRSGSLRRGTEGRITLVPDGAAPFVADVGGRAGGADIRDDALDATGRFLRGEAAVADVRITLSILGLEPGARFSVVHHLHEERRVLRVRGQRLEIVAVDPESSPRLLADAPIAGFPCTVRMETLDGAFRVGFLRADGAFEPVFEGTRDTLRLGTSSRVTIESGHGTTEVGFLDIHRDVHYFWPPALREAQKIRKGRVFLVGDNPRSSRDSREDDDVAHEDLVGRVIQIVWPPSRWRSLQ